MKTYLFAAAAMAFAVMAGGAQAAQTQFFYDNVEDDDVRYPGVTTTINSLGGATAPNLGVTGIDRFQGEIIRNATTGVVSFTFGNLPSHTDVTFNAALAFLNSWDSTNGSPAPDYLFLQFDAGPVIALTAANTSGTLDDFGGGTSLAFGQYFFSGYNDRVIDYSYTVAHTAPTFTVNIWAGGAGWQGGDDESWGMDTYSLAGTLGNATGAVPEPATWALMIGGFGLVGSAMRRRRTAVAA